MMWMANSCGRPARDVEGNIRVGSGAMADFSQIRETFANGGREM